MSDLERALWDMVEPGISRAMKHIKDVNQCDDVVAIETVNPVIEAIVIHTILYC